MKTFRNYQKAINLNEEFNRAAAVKDALQWLDGKYGKELYTFKDIEGMEMSGDKIKTYDINVGEKTYKLNLRKFDSNGDGELDTVGFDIMPDVEEQEEEL